MKTLTEFSALTLRKAAAAREAAGGAQVGAPAAELDDAMDASEEVGEVGEAGEAAQSEAGADAAPEGSSGPAGDVAAAEVTSEHTSDPIAEAMAKELGVQPDRAARLVEALDIVGNRINEVRLVRVFQGDKGPHGSIARGEYHYAIDRVASAKRRGREDRRGGDRRGGDRGGRGPGGPGGDRRDKPRGLGSLKVGAAKDEPREDDRPGRGEMPRAGIGWQLTAAPRDFGGEGRGRGRRGPGGPGGPRGPRGSGGPGDARRDRRDRGSRLEGGGREPRLGPDGQALPPREHAPREHAPRDPRPARGSRSPQDAAAREPRLGPDGRPLPSRPRRERRRIGPDENGLGPDGKPWDPDRRAKRLAERQLPVNAGAAAPVEAASPPTPPITSESEARKE